MLHSKTNINEHAKEKGEYIRCQPEVRFCSLALASQPSLYLRLAVLVRNSCLPHRTQLTSGISQTSVVQVFRIDSHRFFKTVFLCNIPACPGT